MNNREEPVQFVFTLGVDNAISIQSENGEEEIGFGPGTLVAEEIIEELKDARMIE